MAAHLLIVQQERKAATLAAIERAMREIEEEIELNGYYSHNRGRLSRNELCRRAKVGATTLKNPAHAETNLRVQRWLKRLKKTQPSRPALSRPSALAELQARFDQLAANYNRFKLEFLALEKRCSHLEAENASLRRERMKIVPLSPSDEEAPS